MARPSYGDIRVRRAINMAINRSELVARALRGYGLASRGYYSPAVPWAFNVKALVPEYDPDGANRLLDEAGLLRRGPGGFRMEVKILAPISAALTEIGRLLVTQFAAVGIKTELVTLSPADWLERVNRQRDYDLAMTLESVIPDPVSLEFRYSTAGSANFMNYSNAEVDADLAAGASTSDLEERARHYHQAQIHLALDLPAAPLADYVQFVIYHSRVIGLPQIEARGLVGIHDFSLVRIRP